MNRHILMVGIAAVLAIFAVGALTRSANRQRNSSELPTRFVNAIVRSDVPAIDKCLLELPDLANSTFGGERALHIAARANQPAAIEALLAHGADLHARGQWDGTALHWACWFGNKEAAQLLIEKGLAIEDKEDLFGSTPLLWAAHGSRSISNPSGDYVGTVEMLLGHGAAADTYNADGIPALMMASNPVAAVLRAHGAKLPAPTTRHIDGQVA